MIFVLVSLAGCGIFNDEIQDAASSRVEPGTEKVTDDWNCVADQKGLWDCFQSSEVERGQDRAPATAKEPDPIPASDVPIAADIRDAQPANIGGGQQTNEALIKSNHDWQKLSSAAFVLQVASHTSRASAEAALTGLNAPGAQVVKTWSEEGDLFVIIAGSYPDRAAAEAAAEEYTARNQGASYWIRSSAHLLKAL
ncbi:MAG: SPOR domain-containing protein [Halioglobus sp.]